MADEPIQYHERRPSSRNILSASWIGSLSKDQELVWPRSRSGGGCALCGPMFAKATRRVDDGTYASARRPNWRPKLRSTLAPRWRWVEAASPKRERSEPW